MHIGFLPREVLFLLITYIMNVNVNCGEREGGRKSICQPNVNGMFGEAMHEKDLQKTLLFGINMVG